jgi:DNA helicase-2/ATP-dependent DNA helicase PcrA
MQITSINSDTIILDIESHFKVSAGPGAGKTYWLVNHIKNVLNNSGQLSKTRKIGCITYTNIAVETILERLGTSAEQVEVSTIHSFLYKHIVKPYASFIATEYDLNVIDMDGHDEIQTSFNKISNWIENHPNHSKLKHPYTYNQLIKLQNNKSALINWLESIVCKIAPQTKNINMGANRSNAFYLDNNNSRKYLNKNCLTILESDILNYKKLYWKEGKLSHDDILFFSYNIIKKFPFVTNVLAAKFPYLFIDEFQDSNPIQVEIFKILGTNGSFIGVIGDVAQSIYGFQGADFKQFIEFFLPGIKHYNLQENRRSSDEIIDVLNAIRTDITQVKKRNISVEKPIIYVGDMILALKKAKLKCGHDSIYTLSRNNITSNALKAEISGIGLDSKLLTKLKDADSNYKRSNLIYSSIKVIAFIRENKFKDGIKEFEKLFNFKTNKIEGRKKALAHISILQEKFEFYKNGTLLEFANFLKSNIDSDIAKVTSGSIKLFYESHTFNQFYLCVSIPEDMSLHCSGLKN